MTFRMFNWINERLKASHDLEFCYEPSKKYSKEGVNIMFKKIFDLDPNEVETFIKNLIKNRRKKSFDPEEYEQWLKDHEIQVNWCPTSNEFYVQIEPNITTKDYKHWYFKTDKELTAGEYFRLAFDHEHLYFREIYGLMTGETICYSSYDCCVNPNREGYYFIINKEYASIEKDKLNNHYYVRTHDEKSNKDVFELICDTSVIESAIKDYENTEKEN